MQHLQAFGGVRIFSTVNQNKQWRRGTTDMREAVSEMGVRTRDDEALESEQSAVPPENPIAIRVPGSCSTMASILR